MKKISFLYLIALGFFPIIILGCSSAPFGWECREMESFDTRTGRVLSKYSECRKERGSPWVKTRSTYFNASGDVMGESNYKILESKNKSIPDGVQKSYYYDGQLEEESRYVQGKKDGVWKWYYENGQLGQESRYVQGPRDGVWKWYYENGKLQNEETYSYRSRNGWLKSYYENGQLKAEGGLVQDLFKSLITGIVEGKAKKNGVWKRYYENGQLEQEETYSEGNIIGKPKSFDENGNPK